MKKMETWEFQIEIGMFTLLLGIVAVTAGIISISAFSITGGIIYLARGIKNSPRFQLSETEKGEEKT